VRALEALYLKIILQPLLSIYIKAIESLEYLLDNVGVDKEEQDDDSRYSLSL
jgi:hypothetical protein